MNSRLLSVVALAATLVSFADTTVLITTGTVAVPAVAGAAVVAAGLVAGAAAVLGLAKAKRGKRDVAGCLPFDNPELYFSMAANGDFLDCGRRFVCELEATPEENLAEEEVMIRDLFARGSTSVNGTAGSHYREAGLVGSLDGLDACAQTFSSCPFNRKTIFLAYQGAKKGQAL